MTDMAAVLKFLETLNGAELKALEDHIYKMRRNIEEAASNNLRIVINANKEG